MKYASENTIVYLISKIKTALDGKVSTETGKGLSSNDFTTTLKNKLDSINMANYSTTSQMNTAISNALKDITGISFEVVSSLPTSGTAGKIYLKSNGGSGTNIYDEYIYYNSKWEKIGTTDVDLSGYVQTSELTAITNTEIDTEWSK